MELAPAPAPKLAATRHHFRFHTDILHHLRINLYNAICRCAAFVNRGKVHAANGAFTGLHACYLRVHTTMIVLNMIFFF